MHSMTYRRKLAAPLEVAWNAISDVGNYHTVAPNIDHSRVVSGSGKGMIRECSNNDGAWKEVCVEWHPNKSFSFEVDTAAKDYPYPFSKLCGTWSVAPVSEEECEIAMDFEFQFRSEEVERAVYPVMKQQFSEVCEQLLDKWQKQIESAVKSGDSAGSRRASGSMESRRYTTEGFEVHAFVREGRGPTVVLLHGAAGNALAWAPLLPALEGRRLLLVDLPGHGESPPVEDWSLERLARNLVAAIGREEPGPLLWGGHSWGGKVAAILGALFPENALGLLLVDPSPASPVPIDPEVFVATALAPELGPWPSLDAALGAARALPQYGNWNDDLRAAFERGLVHSPDGSVAGRARRAWLVAIAAAALTHDDSSTIRRLSKPTLLVVAEQSVFWQQGTNIAALGDLPNVETVTLPGNHWIHWEPPGALIEAVRPWLGRVSA